MAADKRELQVQADIWQSYSESLSIHHLHRLLHARLRHRRDAGRRSPLLTQSIAILKAELNRRS